MTHYKNGVILAMVLLGLVSLITFAQADPVALGNQTSRSSRRALSIWPRLPNWNNNSRPTGNHS